MTKSSTATEPRRAVMIEEVRAVTVRMMYLFMVCIMQEL
jgi:hypothetical protein